MIIDTYDFDENTETEETVLDLEKLKEKVPTHTSEKLCEMIACDRYLGINKKLTIMCMEELAKRRDRGDNFDYESYIETSLAEYPALDFNLPDLRSIISQAVKK